MHGSRARAQATLLRTRPNFNSEDFASSGTLLLLPLPPCASDYIDNDLTTATCYLPPFTCQGAGGPAEHTPVRVCPTIGLPEKEHGCPPAGGGGRRAEFQPVRLARPCASP